MWGPWLLNPSFGFIYVFETYMCFGVSALFTGRLRGWVRDVVCDLFMYGLWFKFHAWYVLYVYNMCLRQLRNLPKLNGLESRIVWASLALMCVCMQVCVWVFGAAEPPSPSIHFIFFFSLALHTHINLSAQATIHLHSNPLISPPSLVRNA